MFARIFISLIMIVVGYIMVWKANWFLSAIGSIDSAEKYLHSEGGSRLMYKLIGIVIIIIGALYMTGLLEPMMLSLLRTFFPAVIFGSNS